MVTNGVNVIAAEASDSNSSSHSFPLSNPVMHGCSIVSSTKFKGVVPQQNGHWGAQIYANHQRIWLGTFKSEKEAAMAYDSAAIKLRSGDSHRNFPWTRITVEEPNFQNIYSTEAVVNMIKDGSYQAKFADYLRTCTQNVDTDVGLNIARVQKKGVICRQLFQKELTPSDVSKLNRLVIPKKYAIKYFPCISETIEEEENLVDDVQLVFFDKTMRSWKFRYCYWKSSQSFVFTRGWSRFVRENQLKANDTITFYMCECKEGAKEAQPFLMIDVNRGGEENSGLLEGANQKAIQSIAHGDDNGKKLQDCEDQAMDTKPIQEGGNTSFRLFGVQII